jgi:hypothetical protein
MSRLPLRSALGATLAAALVLAGGAATAQEPRPLDVPAVKPTTPPAPQRPKPAAAQPKAKPVATPAAAAKNPAPLTVPVPAPGDIDLIKQARFAKTATCLGSITQAAVATVDGPHKTRSYWDEAKPDSHVFQAIVGIDYKNKTVPHAASIISATPTPDRGCDTTVVQVIPTARSCPDLKAELLKDGQFTDELSGMPLIRSASNFEHLLMPGPGNGCVIVAVGLGMTAPAAPANQVQVKPGVQPPAPESPVIPLKPAAR